MRRIPSDLMVIVGVVLVAFSGLALATQNKDTVQVPGGLALSECKGYEDWAAVSISHPDSSMGSEADPNEKLNLTVAIPTMIDAYRAGVPGNGKPFLTAPRL